MRNLEYTLLDRVTENGASIDRDLQTFIYVTVHIVATDVTSGATVSLESSLDGVNYTTIETVPLTDNGVTEKVLTGVHKHIRANISEYVDGTYSVLFLARG